MEVGKSPGDYFSVLTRRRRTIAAIVLSALTVALLLSIVLPKYYEAKITFYLPIYQGKQVQLSGTPRQFTKSNVAIPVTNEATIRGVLQILLSRKVAANVAYFVPDRTPATIRNNANINVSSEGLFTIKVQDKDPEITASIANAYPLAASQFLEEETGIGRGAKSVREFVESQLGFLQARADTTRDLLSDFLQENEVIAVDQEINKMMNLYANLRTQRFTSQISILENQVKMDALSEQMELAGTDALENFLGTNEVVLSLRGRAANLEIRIAELRQTYTEEHPEIIALRAALEETHVTLKEEIEKIFESYTESLNPIVGQMKEDYIGLQIRKSILLSKTDILDKAVKELEDNFLNLSSVQYEFAKLKKEALMINRIHTSLALKLEELKFQELQSENKFVILDDASVPSRAAFPNLFTNMLTTLALSFLLSILICLIWESREGKAKEVVLEEMTSEDLKGVFFGE
jgi:uncharacterized protein involved in exopolysaccharide biosynthesis